MTEVKRQSMNALKKVGLKTFRAEPQEDGDDLDGWARQFRERLASQLIRRAAR